MLGTNELWLFVVSGLLLNVTPGPDTAYIVGRSVQLGWRGGGAGAIGISCGCLVHVFGAAIGPSAPVGRVRCGDRAVGAVDDLLVGVCGRQAGRRGLPAVRWPSDAAVAVAPINRNDYAGRSYPARARV